MEHSHTSHPKELAELLRLGKLGAPDQWSFDRALWEQVIAAPESDEQDRDIAAAMLFFDTLLQRVRGRMRFHEITLSPPDAARLAISYLNLVSRKLIAHGRKKDAADFDRNYVLTAAGLADPDELITALASGIKHFLIQNARRVAPKEPGHADDPGQHRLIIAEIDNANSYHVLREFMHEVVWNDHELIPRAAHMNLVPRDRDLEIARAISNHRRHSTFRTDFLSDRSAWLRQPSLDECRKRCDIQLVVRVTIREGRVTHAEPGQTDEALHAVANALQGLAEIEAGYFSKLLDRPLPRLGNISVRELLRARLFCLSLAAAIAGRMGSYAENEALSRELAPVMSRSLLGRWLAHALGMDEPRATSLLDALIFRGASGEELFLQPFVPVGDDLCVAFECVSSLQWVRIVEQWMHTGGLQLNERGLFFEPYCRHVLQSRLDGPAAKRGVFVVPQALTFRAGGNTHEIDIVVIFATTVLLIEAKAAGWPEDTAEIGMYVAKLRKAATEQMSPAVRTVRNHSWRARMRTSPASTRADRPASKGSHSTKALGRPRSN